MTDLSEAWRVWSLLAPFTVAGSAILSATLIVLLRPLLVRIAMAKPNARSSHREPTPQGAGAAVVIAVFIACATIFLLWRGIALPPLQLAAFASAALLIAIVGAVDDVRSIEVTPRLLLQAAAAGIVIAALPADFTILPLLPWWIERLLLLIGGIWFVNAVNFMDGIDWMTVAEVVPVSAALALLGMLGLLPGYAIVIALALLGAMLGFAPFNKPVARLFLGDVGSLPIGLVLGFLLLLLAGRGQLAAALLLPLYYLADASLTLFRRMAKGEQFWQAHRTHFYQRATQRGLSVNEVVGSVFVVNVLLAALALVTVLTASWIITACALLAGALLVGWLLYRFDRGRI
jgi:UDP-N-acetylmuramyl pentapeptide phosphotransferase/UDP-N-acetylglucosamine-1-phosphate transferase